MVKVVPLEPRRPGGFLFGAVISRNARWAAPWRSSGTTNALATLVMIYLPRHDTTAAFLNRLSGG